MTLKGLFALWRTVALDPLRFDVAALGAKTSDVPTILAALGAGDAIKLWFPFAFAAAIAGWVLADRDFRATREMVVGGIVIGAVIVGGWYVSGHIWATCRKTRRRSRRNSSPPTRGAPNRSATRRRSPICWSS